MQHKCKMSPPYLNTASKSNTKMAIEGKLSPHFRNISSSDASLFYVSSLLQHRADKRSTPKPVSINSRWKISCDTIKHFTKIEIDYIYNFTLLLSNDLVALSKKIKFFCHDLFFLYFTMSIHHYLYMFYKCLQVFY